MDVKDRRISDLIPAEYNPRWISDDAFEQLKASIQRFDKLEPIIVNMHPERKNIIISGHQRIRAAKDLGIDTFPAVEVELTRDEERELNVRMNKNTGDWDWDELANHFSGEELEDWGFTTDELFNYSPDEFGEDFELPEGEKEPFQQMTFTLADEQAEFIKDRISEVKKTDEYKYAETFGNENSNGNALYILCQE